MTTDLSGQIEGFAACEPVRKEDTLPEFPIHSVESAPEDSRKLLRGLMEQVGFLPNLAATMAGSPTLLEAFLALRSAAARGFLDAATREVVSIAVAFETGCNYCIPAHSLSCTGDQS